jgi:ubiquinone/menaquinone biosynthesis C-methylase UbiE
MFNQNADQWARQEPMILSDFTARPIVLQELAPVAGKHVLDLGCGEGYVARLVAQAGAASVFGIDISSQMVGRAQQAAASGSPCPMIFESGNAVPVSYMHKTFANYFAALAAAGFQTLPKIIELTVSEEHLALDRAFFEGAMGYPLQVLFRIDAQ